MKFTRTRTLIAAATIGVVGIAGVAAAGVAGAQTTDATTQAAHAKGAFIKSLTDEQRSCLQANGVVKPDHKLTKEEKQAAVATLKAAATTCNITLPERPAARAKHLRADLASLTTEQKACLESNGVTKPDHRLTKAERQAFRTQLESAAATCGVTLG